MSPRVQAIPVRMGSHRMMIEMVVRSAQQHQPVLSCGQLVKTALKRCRLDDSDAMLKTYALFERVNGIERALKPSDNVLAVWSQWSASRCGAEVEFVIRKCRTVEKRLMTMSERPLDQRRNSQFIKQCYQKAKQIDVVNEVNVEQVLASFKRAADHNDRKKQRLDHQAPSANINFIKQLYLKLRNQANAGYLLFSDEEESDTSALLATPKQQQQQPRRRWANSNGSSRSPSLGATTD